MKKPSEIINALVPLASIAGAVALYLRGESTGALALLAFASGHLIPSPLPKPPQAGE